MGSSRNWNQNFDNSVVRTKDLKWVRIFTYTSNVQQPGTSWNLTLNNLNTNQGVYDVLFVLSFADNIAATIRGDITWKTGLVESRSQMISVEKNERTFFFQFVIINTIISGQE